jgi:hypothetical protein
MLGEKGTDYYRGGRGGILGEKRKLCSICTISPSVNFFWNTIAA